jgi:quercetin dioxygenase-like cupin family protein
MKHRATKMIVLALMLAAVLGMGGSANSLALQATPAPASGGATREIINEGYPGAAPGQVLQLVRYTIAPDTVLPVHIHPGMQVAVVESGTLHYTVIEGSVAVTRADGTTETLSSGQETDFNTGDRFVESEGMVHFGENRGIEPVVLLVSSLFAADEPPSTNVGVATPAA